MRESATVRQAVTTVCLLFIFTFTEAQSLKDHLQRGDRYFLKKDYGNALKSYEEALALDTNDALVNFKAGISSLNEESISQAVAYLERAYQLKPDVDEDIAYHLGVAYQKDHQFAKARQQFETLRGKNKRLGPIAARKIRESHLGDSLMRIVVPGKVKPVEGEINTNFSEYAPLITDDGKMLLFTSNRTADDYQIKSGTNSGNVYFAEKRGMKWSIAQKVGEHINVSLHETATSVSADGKTLFVYYEEGAGDIYTATRDNGIWSAPVALNKFINHPQYTESSACVSADGKRLFFSSNRPGGKGGFDIYVSEMGTNGQWGRPSNLGSAINTRRDEETPFIDADGSTLYFSSDGHAVLGDKDIFRSRFEKGKWSSPENLGYPINTSGYEGSFILTKDKSTGYFNSIRAGHPGNMDIYQVDFLATSFIDNEATKGKSGFSDRMGSDRDHIFTLLRGSVIDVADGTPLEATLSLVDNSTKVVVSKITTDASGHFEIVIPREGNYGVTTERGGYLFNSMNFTLPAFDKYQEIDTHILMVKARVGSKVILKNIFFDVNQSSLRPESFSELENIRDLLIQHPKWRIQINGHTDNIGPREANVTLSLKRAQAVVEYLIKQGIPAARLQAKGYGPDQPLVSNDDEKDGRQINRRTEIEIVGQ